MLGTEATSALNDLAPAAWRMTVIKETPSTGGDPRAQKGTQSRRTGGDLLGIEKEKGSSERGNASCKGQDVEELDQGSNSINRERGMIQDL